MPQHLTALALNRFNYSKSPMVVPKGIELLTTQQEAYLLEIEKTIKATRFPDAAQQRRFLDQQAKIIVS
jgi:hypothetical protein